MDRIICAFIFAVGVTFVSTVCAEDLLRDPTQPLNYVPETTVTQSAVYNGYRLSAVFLGIKPIAVINGQRCRVGDEIDGYSISKISSEGVVLERGTEQKILKMYRADIIK